MGSPESKPDVAKITADVIEQTEAENVRGSVMDPAYPEIAKIAAELALQKATEAEYQQPAAEKPPIDPRWQHVTSAEDPWLNNLNPQPESPTIEKGEQ